jgi:hypothetical protein
MHYIQNSIKKMIACQENRTIKPKIMLKTIDGNRPSVLSGY